MRHALPLAAQHRAPIRHRVNRHMPPARLAPRPSVMLAGRHGTRPRCAQCHLPRHPTCRRRRSNSGARSGRCGAPSGALPRGAELRPRGPTSPEHADDRRGAVPPGRDPPSRPACRLDRSPGTTARGPSPPRDADDPPRTGSPPPPSSPPRAARANRRTRLPGDCPPSRSVADAPCARTEPASADATQAQRGPTRRDRPPTARLGLRPAPTVPPSPAGSRCN